MTSVDLDRRFLEWKKGADTDPEVWARFRLSDSTLAWSDLLKKRRVVVLAEGGSGKSTELMRQAQRQVEIGADAWYLTVQGVSEDGVEGSLPRAESERFRHWRSSDRPGWLFIDSVDEAKLNHVRFEKALRRIAADISGAESRAHIVISGRHTDWEFLRDLKRLNEALPIPAEPELQSVKTPDELLVRILHRAGSKEEKKPSESALVAVMLPLDAPRVRKFAEGKSVPEVTEFIHQVEQADLWQFARRPLDLGWLLEFWRGQRRLGSLAETLQTSLTERLKEADPERDRRASLDIAQAMAALERLGAAMVFGRATTVAIPDSELNLEPQETTLSFADVLPDYSGSDRAELLIRPVFDPATFGRTRLHNDNLGVVRSYLAARWLLRLRQANLPIRRMFGLLFAESFGLKVIIPSTRETAAWLSLWDRDVGREVAEREPWVLLTGGDPGSLPAETRRAVLRELAQRMVNTNFSLPQLDPDSLKRFSSPELADTVRELWFAHPAHSELRWLLLRLISLGGLKSCSDLAIEVALSRQTDRRFRLLAGKALVAAADDDGKRQYADFIRTNLVELPNAVIWDAVELLFPAYMSVDDLLSITATKDVTDSDGGLGFEWQGPQIVQRLTSMGDIEQLLRGLLDQLGGRAGSIGRLPDKREEAYSPAIAALACELLRHSGQDEVPKLVVEASLRLGQEHRGSTMTPWQPVKELPNLVLCNPSRRRLMFWEAAERLGDHPALRGKRLEAPYQMRILGWWPRLAIEDLDWLLVDGPKRAEPSERRLAVVAALDVAQSAGAAPDLLSRIEKAAMEDCEMRMAFELAMAPRTRTPEEQASEAELKEVINRNDAAQAERDQSWIDFVAGLRADPGQLSRLCPTTEHTADARLVGLWQLLDSANHGKNRYAIDDLSAVEPILGPEVTAALRAALIGFWRSWAPRLASTRPPSERNQGNTFDGIGITGITLEARSDEQWATRLSPTDATRAAEYATLEINGFPAWISDLARVHPREVAAVLTQEVHAETFDGPSASLYKMLQNIAYGEAAIKELMVTPLLDLLEQHTDIPEAALAFILDIIGESVPPARRPEALRLALERFAHSDSVAAALYIGLAFTVDPDPATDALDTRLDSLSAGEQTELVERILPLLFGDRPITSGAKPKSLTFSCLAKIVRIAYSAVRVSDDRQRESGTAYSPDQRDRAQWARSAAFNTLVATPGRATFDALLGFREVPHFPVSPEHLMSLAIDRAAADSEHAPWLPVDAKTFEETHEAVPRTPLDLQRLVLNRLTDIQNDLVHSDFEQGRTLKGLVGETAVQKWVADRLDLTKGQSYSVERESHVVEEKEPDIRLRAKASSATVPTEVKVAESWTLAQLESALVDQLCGKYLRAKEARHGILLIVHQERRPRGWQIPGSDAYIDFATLTQRLTNLAHRIAGEDSIAPQPEIAILNVSEVSPIQ